MTGRIGKADRAGREPSLKSRPSGDHPLRKAHVISGIAYILPRSEGSPVLVRKVGAFGVGIGLRWSSFGLGVDILSAGVLVMVGPLFIWVAHINRQISAYERKYLAASAIEAGTGETRSGSTRSAKARAGAKQ